MNEAVRARNKRTTHAMRRTKSLSVELDGLLIQQESRKQWQSSAASAPSTTGGTRRVEDSFLPRAPSFENAGKLDHLIVRLRSPNLIRRTQRSSPAAKEGESQPQSMFHLDADRITAPPKLRKIGPQRTSLKEMLLIPPLQLPPPVHPVLSARPFIRSFGIVSDQLVCPA